MNNMLGAVDRISSRFRRASSLLPLDTTSKLREDSYPPPPSLPPPPVPPPPSPAAPPATGEARSRMDESPSFDRPLSCAPPTTPQHSHTASSDASIAVQTPTPITPPARTMCGTPTSVPSNAGSLNESRPQTAFLAPPPASNPAETIIVGGQELATPPVASRPSSSHLGEEMESTTNRRKSWLPAVLGNIIKSRHTSQELDAGGLEAWVSAGEAKIQYNCQLLIQGERIPELWNDGSDADTYVYLFPRESGRGPQMKVYSRSLSASQPLTQLMYGDISSDGAREKCFDGRSSLTIEDAMRTFASRNTATPPLTPRRNASETHSTSDGSSDSIRSSTEGVRELHLYFPAVLTNEPAGAGDTQALVDARNLFAFLCGQPLVATPVYPSTFRVLLALAAHLNHYQFSNIDGSDFGEAVIASTTFLVDDLKIADVRSSDAKILEALILGENLKLVALYNQAFAYAAGKYDVLPKANPPLWNEVSEITRTKLYQASSDLKNKIKSAEPRLNDFNFPSLFTGIGGSTSSAESKIVRFAKWKYHFLSMRRQALAYYKEKHGSWPPRANSKNNQFLTGGLNRLVLKGLYKDLCVVYDCLADRTAFTTRGLDEADDNKPVDDPSPMHTILRKILAEFDRSAPPVQPPIPFDVPLLPSIATVEPSYSSKGPKDQNKLRERKLKDYEMELLLAKASTINLEPNQPFLEAFRMFEKTEARGLNTRELVEMRYGHWLFIYTVLQSLPLLVTDIPDLLHTDGVESWLCQHPLGGLPWLQDSGAIKKSWYGVGGAGGNVVSMPSDVVNYGVEATYRRSHCWAVAAKWLSGEVEDDGAMMTSDGEVLSPLSPPPGFAGGELGVRGRQRAVSGSSGGHGPDASRSGSRHNGLVSRQSQRNSIALGLERLPFPAGEQPYSPGQSSRPGSSGTNPSHGTMKPASRNTSPMTRSAGPGQRSASHVRLDSSNSVSSVKGSNFDDILSDFAATEKQRVAEAKEARRKVEKEKKGSKFLPF